MKLKDLREEVEALQQEVDALSAEYDKTLNNNKSKKEVDQEDKQHDVFENEDFLAAKLGGYEYFDSLINGMMLKGVRDRENSEKGPRKRQKRINQQNASDFQKLKDKYGASIRLENCYRLGGVSAFPVNVPKGEEDEYLGIRFDTFDPYESRFLLPDYIILKKKIKNNEWFVFKSTISKFIPVDNLAAKYLNTDLRKFVFSVRKFLNQYQLRRSVFTSLATKVLKPWQLTSDLSYTKVNIRMNKHLELILICGQTKIENVIIICDPIGPDGRPMAVTKRKLELALKGLLIDKFDKVFPGIMKSCWITI